MTKSRKIRREGRRYKDDGRAGESPSSFLGSSLPPALLPGGRRGIDEAFKCQADGV